MARAKKRFGRKALETEAGRVSAALLALKVKEVVCIGDEKARTRWLQTALVLRNAGVLTSRLKTWVVGGGADLKAYFGMLV